MKEKEQTKLEPVWLTNSGILSLENAGYDWQEGRRMQHSV